MKARDSAVSESSSCRRGLSHRGWIRSRGIPWHRSVGRGRGLPAEGNQNEIDRRELAVGAMRSAKYASAAQTCLDFFAVGAEGRAIGDRRDQCLRSRRRTALVAAVGGERDRLGVIRSVGGDAADRRPDPSRLSTPPATAFAAWTTLPISVTRRATSPRGVDVSRRPWLSRGGEG